MKTALPWVLVVLLLGGGYYLYSQGQAKDSQIALLQQQSDELTRLRAENEELGKLRAQAADIDRLRKDNEELPKLRNEARQLREQTAALNKQLQTAQAQGAQLQAQQQQAASDLQQMRTQAQQQQLAVGAKVQANVCINNLRQLEAAKQQWVLQNQKPQFSVPTPQDLLPYLPGNAFPACPGGGQYTLSPLGTPSKCSVPGHALQ